MNIAQVKQISIVKYLESIGIKPKYQKGYEALYISPIRDDKNPSLSVNTLKNVWYDHGSGESGSIIDLVMKIRKVSFNQAIHLLLDTNINESFFFSCPSESTENKLTINHTQVIKNKALIKYIRERNINLDLARMHLSEAYYSIGTSKKQFFALAFRNDKGGYELRNKLWKGCASPKSITTIPGNIERLEIFEGFFDYLSYLTFFNISTSWFGTTIILNSLSLLPTLLNDLNNYKSIDLFLDNDNAGFEAAKRIRVIHPKVYMMNKRIYPNHKDFNAYLQYYYTQ